MRKNKNLYFIYGMSIFFGVLFAYHNFDKNKDNITTQKTIEILMKDKIKVFTETFDINDSMGYIWGIKDVQIKVEDENKSKISNPVQQIIKQGKNNICIDKKCYRFLGFYYKKNVPYVTFYSKEFPKGIKDFTLHEKITNTLVVDKIIYNKLFLTNENNTAKWHFKLFDVNVTKYKPKDINETDY